jgi:putative transposase
VFKFIEDWYNPRRRHSLLDYQSPNDYERSHALREVPENAELSTEPG